MTLTTAGVVAEAKAVTTPSGALQFMAGDRWAWANSRRIKLGRKKNRTGLTGHSDQTFRWVGPIQDYDSSLETLVSLRLVDGSRKTDRVSQVVPHRGNPIPDPVE